MTKTYLKFLKDIISQERDVKYFAEQNYLVQEERNDIYVLKKHNPAIIHISGNMIEIDGVEKGLDGKIYDVIEIEVD